MSSHTARATGSDLATVLATAAGDLLSDDVAVEARLPQGIELSDIEVTLRATVRRPSDNGDAPEAPAEQPDDDQSDDTPGDEPSDEATVEDLSDDDVDDEVDDVDEVDHDEDADPDDPGDGGLVLTDDELDELDEEADAGADFVEGLLDAMDLPGELRIRVLEDTRRAEVEVVDMGTGALIGRRGSTLEAVQELMRCALQSQFERRVHVHVDVEGYRARRLEKLLDKADEAIDQVLDTGEPERLEPMDVFERKAIHEFVNTVEGVLSRSQGREPSRRIVLEPTED